MAQERKLILDHKPGLHIRAAMILVGAAQQFESKITVIYKGQEADAKSIYGLVGLCAVPQSKLTIRAEGADEAKALKAIVDLIKVGFNENFDGD